MNAYKKWCLTVIFSVLLMLFGVGLLNYIVDPYEHYRFSNLPKSYLKSRMFLIQRQFTAGFAKHMDYDTVLVGSSMTEYFSIDYMDKILGSKSAKLSISGGTTYEIKTALTTAIKTGQVKTALISSDVYMYNNPVEFVKAPIAGYLYNDNIFDDVKYLLNKDVLLNDTIPLLKARLGGEENFDWDDLYNNSEECTFSKEETMKHYELPKPSEVKVQTEPFTEVSIKKELSEDPRIQTMKANFNENLLNIIKENPDIQFKIFFPPNSILYWDSSNRDNEVRNQAAFKTYMYEVLSKYKNVTMYDFQDLKDITYNLNYYKDRSHYGPTVCNYIVDSIANGSNQLNDSNYIKKAVDLVNQAENFSLSQLK